MRHTNINIITHQWIHSVIHPTDVVIDATAGNGHDTLFLSTHANHVFAFDISLQAIKQTKEKTQQQNNISLICDSHEYMDQHIHTPITGIVYNCGYLPNSDHQSVTHVHSTIASLEIAKKLLKKDGWFCITVYFNHKQGKEEAESVLTWLNNNTLIENTYTYEGVYNAPIAYFARKK